MYVRISTNLLFYYTVKVTCEKELLKRNGLPKA